MDEHRKLIEAVQRIEEYLDAKLVELKNLSQAHITESKRRGAGEQSKLYMRVTTSRTGRAIVVAWYHTKFWKKRDGTYHRELKYLGKGNMRTLTKYTQEWELNWLQTMVAAENEITKEARNLNKAIRLLNTVRRKKRDIREIGGSRCRNTATKDSNDTGQQKSPSKTRIPIQLDDIAQQHTNSSI